MTDGEHLRDEVREFVKAVHHCPDCAGILETGAMSGRVGVVWGCKSCHCGYVYEGGRFVPAVAPGAAQAIAEGADHI